MVLAMTLAAQDAPGAVEGPAPDEPRDYSRSPPRTVQDAFGTFERKIASDRAALSWLQNRVVQLQSEMEQLLRRLMDAAQRLSLANEVRRLQIWKLGHHVSCWRSHPGRWRSKDPCVHLLHSASIRFACCVGHALASALIVACSVGAQS